MVETQCIDVVGTPCGAELRANGLAGPGMQSVSRETLAACRLIRVHNVALRECYAFLRLGVQAGCSVEFYSPAHISGEEALSLCAVAEERSVPLMLRLPFSAKDLTDEGGVREELLKARMLVLHGQLQTGISNAKNYNYLLSYLWLMALLAPERVVRAHGTWAYNDAGVPGYLLLSAETGMGRYLSLLHESRPGAPQELRLSSARDGNVTMERLNIAYIPLETPLEEPQQHGVLPGASSAPTPPHEAEEPLGVPLRCVASVSTMMVALANFPLPEEL